MPDEKLVIKKADLPSGWKPITISTEAYAKVKNLADETNLPISTVAVKLLEFAIERVVIE